MMIDHLFLNRSTYYSCARVSLFGGTATCRAEGWFVMDRPHNDILRTHGRRTPPSQAF